MYVPLDEPNGTTTASQTPQSLNVTLFLEAAEVNKQTKQQEKSKWLEQGSALELSKNGDIFKLSLAGLQ